MKTWLADCLIVAAALAALTAVLGYLLGTSSGLQFHALFLLGCFGVVSGISEAKS